jgi:hypothetical protein
MVLMTGQGGTTRKGLLAIGIWTLVRTLSGVDTSVPRQRARVTKRLSAALAHVRLLASVDALMHSQGRTLDELLAAIRILAHVRADTTVDTFMTCKVTTTREALAAGRTRERFWWTSVGCWPATRLLALLVWRLLLRVRVVRRVRDVVVIVEQGHRGLHV